MNREDLIKMGPVRVKKNAQALSLYKSEFREAFGRDPVCATCGTSQGAQDWKAFVALVNGVEVETIINNFTHMQNMKNDKTFKIKNPLKIHKYAFEKNGRKIYNSAYGDVMTEEFAIAYLENATDEEFEQRSLDFITLPAKFRLSPEELEAMEAIENEEPVKTGDEEIKASIDTTDRKVEETQTGKTEEPDKTLKDFKFRELMLVAQNYPEDEYKSYKKITELADYLAGKGVTVDDIEDAILQS
jgi:hypothetical protein